MGMGIVGLENNMIHVLEHLEDIESRIDRLDNHDDMKALHHEIMELKQQIANQAAKQDLGNIENIISEKMDESLKNVKTASAELNADTQHRIDHVNKTVSDAIFALQRQCKVIKDYSFCITLKEFGILALVMILLNLGSCYLMMKLNTSESEKTAGAMWFNSAYQMGIKPEEWGQAKEWIEEEQELHPDWYGDRPANFWTHNRNDEGRLLNRATPEDLQADREAYNQR